VYSVYRFIAKRLRREKNISLSDVIVFTGHQDSSVVSSSSINLLFSRVMLG
jgi:hypothetical protein